MVNPDDFEYLVAFRFPGGEVRPQTIAYDGNAMTFNPDDNSLLIMGHDRIPHGGPPNGHQVAEVSIPALVISKNVEDLYTTEFIQNIANVVEG